MAKPDRKHLGRTGFGEQRMDFRGRRAARCMLISAAFVTAGQAAAVANPGEIPAGARYVAMGSSFAAGPGITTSADMPPDRCQRSMDNYAHQLARKRGLALFDVSCGGATTTHILNAWQRLPPQIDAVTADTRLVTLTIGGNDLNFIGNLIRAACPVGRAEQVDGQRMCAPPPPVGPQQFSEVEAAFYRIVAEIRRRAPAARIVLVDYVTVLPQHGTCALTPMAEDAATASRTVAATLATITARVARTTGVGLIRASRLSRGHDACSKTPWVTGFSNPGGRGGVVPYHPNLAAMSAIAMALDKSLQRR